MADRGGRPAPKPADAGRSRWAALIVLCVGMLMIVLDTTVVNVALPAIQNDLHFTQSSLAWVMNAYMIAFGGLLLLAGRMGDLISRRGIFLAGLGVFTLASIACGAAQNQVMLVAARFVQGVGGAMTSAVILGMIVTMFPEARDRARAIGVFAFVASAGGSIGLLAGGVLTQGINWHWIFFINVPIGITTVVAALRVLPADRGIGLGRGADIPGAVLITGALMVGVYTIVQPDASGPLRAVLAAVAVLLLAGFLVREATARTPLVPLRIFRNRAISGANAVQALMVAGMFGLFFLGALYLRQVLGYDPLTTGLAFLPATIVMGALSVRYSEKLIMRFGARRVLLPGLLLMAAALALLVRAPVNGTYALDVLPTMLLLGAGGGVVFPALMTLSMSSATPDDAGLVSGLVNTTMQVGGSLGLAVLVTVAAARTQGLTPPGGQPTSAALTSGYRMAFLIGMVLILVAFAIGVTVLRPSPPSDDNQDTDTEAQREPVPAGPMH